MSWTTFLFSPSGRVNRKQFWLWFVLPALGISAVLAPLDVAGGTFDETTGMGEMSGLFSLALLYPSIILQIKRFHDRDKSGWWNLILLIPILGALWLLIEVGLLRGTPGPNRFGPPANGIPEDAAMAD